MPTISFAIGGKQHDISGKSGKEVVAMVVKEIKKKKFIVRKKEEPEYCECDFPKFIINDGIQSCSRCGKDDHYKCGVVADHSEDEEEGH